MRKFEWERKPSKKQPTSKENITIIRTLNNFGRVPEQHELLDEIERLQQELQRKDNNWNELKTYIQMNINATCNMNNDNYNEGRYMAYCDMLDKIKELEEK